MGDKNNLTYTIQVEAEMVPLTSSTLTNAKTRRATFLNPTSYGAATATPAPPPEKLPTAVNFPKTFSFECCPSSLPKWREWFSRLEPTYGHLWKKASILEALKISLYSFTHCNRDLLCGFLPYWSSSTNTFVFQFGEATVTLQDVAILGGLSVLGEPARQMGPPSEEQEYLYSRLVVEHRSFHKRKAKKPSYSEWMGRFMEEENRELEHVAFLSLWLSRYLFSAPPSRTVTISVFHLAIRLSVGKRVALAPAVLATVYRDLRILRQNANAIAGTPSVVWAPIHLVQLWIWERFPPLRPKTAPHQLRPGQPWALRWHSVRSTWKTSPSPSSVDSSTVSSSSSFRWSPYRGRAEAVVVGGAEYARCVRPAELVGLDCVEQYQPHRVAMQLGLDQDVPPLVKRANATWDLAWRSYDGAPMESAVMPAAGEVGVTLQYWKWWRGTHVGGGDAAAAAAAAAADDDDDDEDLVCLSQLGSWRRKGKGSIKDESWQEGSTQNYPPKKKRKGDSIEDPITSDNETASEIPEFAEEIMRDLNSLDSIVAGLKAKLS